MTIVKRTFSVDVAPDRAVAYIADFTNAEQWDPGTVSCVRVDDGPVRVGATWRNTSKLFGVSTELTYTLEQLTDMLVVIVGRNKTATSSERINVVRTGAGSEVTYVNDTVFNGAAKLAAPIVKLVFERIANEVVQGLTENLNVLGERSGASA